jgi:hypothetical protein
MTTGTENDIFLAGDRLIGPHLHVVQISEWRHRPRFAIGEQAYEVVFASQ